MAVDNCDPAHWDLNPPFRHAGGALWLSDLPVELRDASDTQAAPFRSRLRVFEDGRGLGPGHAVHQEIERGGGGRYSFWHASLYFSTSDGSDPNSNGRSYSVQFRPENPRPVPRSDRAEPVWEVPARPLRCAVVGMGNRGLYLAQLARAFAGVEIAWVVDCLSPRVDRAVDQAGTAGVRATSDFGDAIRDPTVDIVFVTVPDHLHRAVAEAAFAAGKDVFLEKPITTNLNDARAILAAWQRSGRILHLGYVLRQALFYRTIRGVVGSGMLGPVRQINVAERLYVLHGASFMRRWHAQSTNSGGLMVHKGCHDLDLVCWLLGTRPRRVSSFGGLDTFVGPAPAEFCSQCDRRDQCAYVDMGVHEDRSPPEWQDPTAYGLDRCVFRTDKDIIDNQLVAFELDSGARGTFQLSMQNPQRTERHITLIGDAARLDGVFEDGRFTVVFTDPEEEPVAWSAEGGDTGGHHGGDARTMRELLMACTGRAPPSIQSPDDVMPGMVFATAAERARKMGTVVEVDPSEFQLGPPIKAGSHRRCRKK